MGERRQRLTPATFYRILHRIADRKVGPAEEAFLQAISVGLASIDPSRLEAALGAVYRRLEEQQRRGERLALPDEVLTEVFDAVGINGQLTARVKAEYATLLRGVVLESGVATASLTPAQFTLRFDVTNPRATRFAATQSSKFTREFATETKKAIRREIATGFREGRTVQKTAKALRDVVGLSNQQARWLGNFRRTWIPEMQARAASGLPLLKRHKRRLRQLKSRFPTQDKPFTADEIEGLTNAYRERLVRLRATQVARTETIRASAGGQIEAWRQMADKGLLDLKVARVHWSYTKDALTDCSCKSIPELNPNGVELGQPFRMRDCRTGLIVWVRIPGDPHPACRCALYLVFRMDIADVEVAA